MAIAVSADTLIKSGAGTFGIVDAGIHITPGLFHLHGPLDQVCRAHFVWMPQVKIGKLGGQQFRRHQTGTVIRFGVGGNVQRPLYGLGDALGTQITTACIALALPLVNADGQAAIAMMLNRFHLAHAHGGGQAAMAGNAGFSGAGTKLAGLGNDFADQSLELLRREILVLVSRSVCCRCCCCLVADH